LHESVYETLYGVVKYSYSITIGISLLIANIISDYLSLFIVRRNLDYEEGHFIKALFSAALTGIVSVVLIFYVFVVLDDILFPFFPAFGGSIGESMKFYIVNIYSIIEDAKPALIVHLWLPLFAVSILALRLLQAFRNSIGKAQWFLRGGTSHPLRASGLVAAILVFVGTGIFHLIRWSFG
jgi:hypothetical protein